MLLNPDTVEVTLRRSATNFLTVSGPDARTAMYAAWDYFRLGISGVWAVTHVEYRRDGTPAEWVLQPL